MKKTIMCIIIFLIAFIALPKVMSVILTGIAGGNAKTILMFCDAAFILTYIFKSFLVSKIFKPENRVAYGVYFILMYLVVIAGLKVLATIIL